MFVEFRDAGESGGDLVDLSVLAVDGQELVEDLYFVVF